MRQVTVRRGRRVVGQAWCGVIRFGSVWAWWGWAGVVRPGSRAVRYKHGGAWQARFGGTRFGAVRQYRVSLGMAGTVAVRLLSVRCGETIPGQFRRWHECGRHGSARSGLVRLDTAGLRFGRSGQVRWNRARWGGIRSGLVVFGRYGGTRF
jgi:hypothetical protein